MSSADVLQFISVAAVVVALIFTFWQTREATKQANESAKQVALSLSVMKQHAYQQVTTYGADFNAILFNCDDDLLSWFLSTRGIPVGEHATNLRCMFMFVRMDVHESVFLSHQDGVLDRQAWRAWLRVIELDAATVEFKRVWNVVADQYVPAFRDFVDSVNRSQSSSLGSP